MCKDTIIVVRESLFQNSFYRSVLADYVEGWFVLEPTLLEPNLYAFFFTTKVVVIECTLLTLTFRYYKIFFY